MRGAAPGRGRRSSLSHGGGGNAGGADALARTLDAGVLGVALGVAPALAFYWAATGNPFRPVPGWHGGTVMPVQGGGLRLANFPRTFKGNWQLIQATYGSLFLALAMWGAGVALVLRPTVLLLTVPYVTPAMFLYSAMTAN